jgi:hypothetical protein
MREINEGDINEDFFPGLVFLLHQMGDFFLLYQMGDFFRVPFPAVNEIPMILCV